MIRTPLLAAAVPITVALAPVQPNNTFGPVSPQVLSAARRRRVRATRER